jgi:hypothetical protein
MKFFSQEEPNQVDVESGGAVFHLRPHRVGCFACFLQIRSFISPGPEDRSEKCTIACRNSGAMRYIGRQMPARFCTSSSTHTGKQFNRQRTHISYMLTIYIYIIIHRQSEYVTRCLRSNQTTTLFRGKQSRLAAGILVHHMMMLSLAY